MTGCQRAPTTAAARRWPALVSLAALALAGACATPAHLPGGGRSMSWPRPPEPPRIGLIGEFSSAGDLGVGSSGLAAVWDFVSGVERLPFLRPYAIAVFGDAETTGPGGLEPGPAVIAVADTESRSVHLIDLAARETTEIVETGEDEPLESPVGVAFDGAGRLYVCDSERAFVARYDTAGRFDRIVARGSGRPAGVAVDADRQVLYVADATEHVVRRYTLDGAPQGDVHHRFHYPTHLAVGPDGTLLVSDSLNFRVVALSPDGELLASVGSSGDASGNLQRPKGVGLSREGHLYVVDALFDNVQIFDLQARLLLAFGSPGPGPGEFTLPAGLAADERDIIYVADAFNSRIQLFRYLPGERP